MRITAELTESAVLTELGRRVKAQRIAARLTQAELAEQAGVGKRTLERLEAGGGSELLTLVRVLRVLDRLEGFEQLLPVAGPGPIARLKARGGMPRRVRHSRVTEAKRNDKGGEGDTDDWTWGEDG